MKPWTTWLYGDTCKELWMLVNNPWAEQILGWLPQVWLQNWITSFWRWAVMSCLDSIDPLTIVIVIVVIRGAGHVEVVHPLLWHRGKGWRLKARWCVSGVVESSVGSWMVTYRLSRRIHSAQYSHLKFVLYYKTTYFCIVWSRGSCLDIPNQEQEERFPDWNWVADHSEAGLTRGRSHPSWTSEFPSDSSNLFSFICFIRNDTQNHHSQHCYGYLW